MPYVEEREFTLRVMLRSEFADDYDGDEDGYAWAQNQLPAVASDLVRAAVQVLTARSGWKVRPANRGRSSEDEVTLVAERVVTA